MRGRLRVKRSAPADQTPHGPYTSIAASSRGSCGIQSFRRLARQHPNLERDEIWALAGYGPRERAIEAGQAPWADGRASPAQARIRNDPRPD